MIAHVLQGIRANGVREKMNFGPKIALSQLIDGASRKTYSVLRLSEDHVS